jgi:hypothetical protein
VIRMKAAMRSRNGALSRPTRPPMPSTYRATTIMMERSPYPLICPLLCEAATATPGVELMDPTNNLMPTPKF